MLYFITKHEVNAMSNRKNLDYAGTQLPLFVEKDEDGFYVVECPVFEGCYAQGKTIDKALKNIREVIKNAGYTNRDVSITCHSDYTIHVINKTRLIDENFLFDVVKHEYNKKPHSWLLVMVDGFWLDFTNKVKL